MVKYQSQTKSEKHPPYKCNINPTTLCDFPMISDFQAPKNPGKLLQCGAA